MRNRWIRLALQYTFVVGLIVFLATHMNWNALGRALMEIPWHFFFAGFFLEQASYILDATRFFLLSDRLIPFRAVFTSKLGAAFAALVIPGSITTDLARVFYFARSNPKLRKTFLLSLLLANRGLHLLGFLAFLALKMPLLALVPLLPVVVRIRSIRGIALNTIRLFPRTARRMLHSVWHAVVQVAEPRKVLGSAVISLLICCALIGEFALGGQAVGIALSMEQWIWLILATTFSMLIPVGLGAIGTQDAAIIVVLGQYAIPMEKAAALSVFIHLIRYLGCIPGIAFVGRLLPSARQVGTSHNPQ